MPKKKGSIQVKGKNNRFRTNISNVYICFSIIYNLITYQNLLKLAGAIQNKSAIQDVKDLIKQKELFKLGHI